MVVAPNPECANQVPGNREPGMSYDQNPDRNFTHLPDKPKPFLAYLWLSYTGFLFIQPILEPNLYLWLGTLAVFAIFIVVFSAYTRLYDRNDAAVVWMIAATLALGLITFPWNGGGSTFYIYAAAFLPFSVPSARRVLLLLLAMSGCIVVEHFIFSSRHSHFYVSWPNTGVGIFLVLCIGISNIFFAEQRRSNRRLAMAHEEIEAIAAVAERERIARDLHDVLGHTLSVITLKAELAGRLIASDPARATAEIADVERTARTALAEVREAIGGYRSRGLKAEIASAHRALDLAGVNLIVDSAMDNAADASPPGSERWDANLSAAEETVLALALREAVTNIVRHARARTCRLRFVTEQGHRRLLVEDDGQHTLAREGNGLRGMRERVESLGGKLSLTRDPGTRLLIELPLHSTPQPEAAA
jgi:two-component system sensor histidine kinase DesK